MNIELIELWKAKDTMGKIKYWQDSAKIFLGLLIMWIAEGKTLKRRS